jgi:hypothetical protein
MQWHSKTQLIANSMKLNIFQQQQQQQDLCQVQQLQPQRQKQQQDWLHHPRHHQHPAQA